MSLNNQSELFLGLDELLMHLNKVSFSGISYDNRKTINAITYIEATKLLVKHPGLSKEVFNGAVEALLFYLQRPKVLSILSGLGDTQSTLFSVTIKENKVNFYLTNLDLYLFESEGETLEMRDRRVEQFLLDFIQDYPLYHVILDQNTSDAQDRIYKYLKIAASTYYFLSNEDLARLLTHLINDYNNQSGLFQTDRLSNNTQLINLSSRSILLKNDNQANQKDYEGK